MSIERTPTNDQIAAVLLRTGNPTDEQKEQLAEYLGRAPATEKAAPIPADVLALARLASIEIGEWVVDRSRKHPRDIVADLLLADRASQEERIREDERPEGADEADMIIAAGRKMAARIGAEFVIDPQKLADFRARLRGGAS